LPVGGCDVGHGKVENRTGMVKLRFLGDASFFGLSERV